MIRRLARLVLGFCSAMLIGGCGGPYVLTGRTVEGDLAMVEFIDQEDDQLTGSAVANARIEIYRDPTTLNRSLAARGRTDGSGEFSIKLDAFGAGWMEERWLIQVVRPGYETIEQLITLPPMEDRRRLQVLMRPGESIPPQHSEDLWDEYERYK